MAAKSSSKSASPSSDTTITALRTTLLRAPWVGEPPAAGIIPPGPREFVVVEIMTKGGLTGMGYLMPLRGGTETLDACIRHMMAPMILGRDATEIEATMRRRSLARSPG